MRKHLILGLIVVLAATAGLAADPNSVGLLRRGLVQLDAGNDSQAAEYLRLACFGLLDEPSVLAECLVPLALAYDRLGRADEFRAVFERVVEVEERFSGYSEASLDANRRRDFEIAVNRHLPQSMIGSIPAFSHLVPTEEERIAGMGTADRRQYFERQAEVEPNEPRWRVELARLDLADGRTRRALRHLDAALAAAPDDQAANLEMARLDADDGQWFAATRHYEASGRATDTARDAALYLLALEGTDRLDDVLTVSGALPPDIAEDSAVARIVERTTAEVERREAEALAAAEAAAAAAEEAAVASEEPDATAGENIEEPSATAVPTADLEPPPTTPSEDPVVDNEESQLSPIADSEDVRVVDLPLEDANPAEATPTPTPTPIPTPDPTPTPSPMPTPKPTPPADEYFLPGSASTLVRVETQGLRERTVVTLTFDQHVNLDTVYHWRLSDPPRHVVAVRGVDQKRVPYQVDVDDPRVIGIRSAVHTEKTPVETHVVIDRRSDDIVVDSVKVAGRVIIVDFVGEN